MNRSRLNILYKLADKFKRKGGTTGSIRKYNHFYSLDNITKHTIKDFIIKDWKSVYLEQDMFVDSTATLYKDFTSFEELTNETENFLVSVDCEMTMSEKGYELGRVSILNHGGDVLYDKIILPENEIIDYKTEYSGLTEESFDKAITFQQMKTEINQIIGKNTVILGHGLFNDLNMLKIKHDKFIDTSFIYRTKNNYRISLKILALKLLQKKIQGGMHCSIEDGMACLELLALKIGEFSGDEIDFGIGVHHSYNTGQLESDGIHFIKLKETDTIPFRNSFSLYIYEDEGRLHFII